MNGASIELIATDIDGTMLRSDGSLSPRVGAALGAAVACGIHVVPVTGRPVVITHDVIQASGLEDFWIFANGAITRHLGRDELVRGFWLDPALAVGLVDRLRQSMPSVGFAIEFEHAVAFESGFDSLVPVVPAGEAIDDVRRTLMSPAGALERGRVQKILAYDLAREFDDLFHTVNGAVADDAVASHSGLRFVELAAGEVTKATALELLAADLGIDVENVACFGDNQNDVTMLEWAGVSYAMGNASPVAKAAADETIGGNDDDGLAIKIEELLADR